MAIQFQQRFLDFARRCHHRNVRQPFDVLAVVVPGHDRFLVVGIDDDRRLALLKNQIPGDIHRFRRFADAAFLRANQDNHAAISRY